MEPERIWHYHFDADGHLWHEGTEIDDPQVLNIFMRKMEVLPAGGWKVLCQGEVCLLTAEDVPYVVQQVTFSPKQVILTFPGGYTEPLDPATLEVGRRNVLYCGVRDGKFTARFNRSSYLDLAKQVEFDSKSKVFFLIVDKRRYVIKGVT